MRRGIRILLVIPLVFNGLVVALSMATVAVPTPAVRVGLFIALTAPLIALPLLLRIGAAAGLVVVTAVVSVVRWVVALAGLNDPYAYYAWPVDVVLSIGLMMVAWRVGPGSLLRAPLSR